MGQTSSGLPNNGQTAHYQISYDTTFSQPDGLNRATALLAVCEADFTLMSNWFGGVKFIFNFPLPVQIVNSSGGGGWIDPSDIEVGLGASPTVTLKPGSDKSVEVLRYLLVAEVTEMFMASQKDGWFEPTGAFNGADEGSKGEGLSRFLAGQFLLAMGFGSIPPPGYAITSQWLNGSGRPDFVNNNPDDNAYDVTNGCTTLFVYYLNSQLGFSINQIIASGSGNLNGVFQNLTGQPDGWTPFINLVNQYYPPTITCIPNGDNIFPVRNLAQFFQPAPITCGYSEATLVSLDGPASAQVVIQLSSDNPALVSVPAKVTVLTGAVSASITIQTTALQTPFAPFSVNVHASYAGKTLTVAVQVVPPAAASVSLMPDTVTCGDSSAATVSLDFPSLLGSVVVDLNCSAPGFATVPPQITIPQGQASASITVDTPVINTPFPIAHATITASSRFSPSATLTILPKVVAGILNTLAVSPATISHNLPGRGMVTLLEAVPKDTEVVLEALDPIVTPQGILPGQGTKSSLVTVPASVTIPAGGTVGIFTVKANALAMQGSKSPVRIFARAVVNKFVTVLVTS